MNLKGSNFRRENLFTPLAVFLEYDDLEISTVRLKELREVLMEKGYSRIGLIGSRYSSGFLKALHLLKDFKVSLGFRGKIPMGQEEVEFYIYPTSEDGYRRCVEFSYREKMNLQELEGLDAKVLAMAQNNSQVNHMLSSSKAKIMLGLPQDYLGGSYEALEPLIRGSKELVALPKVTYLRSFKALDTLLCVKNNLRFYLEDRVKADEGQRLLDAKSYGRIYSNLPEAYLNVLLISENSWVPDHVAEPKLDFFPRQESSSALVRETLKGLLVKDKFQFHHYKRRALYELRVILDKAMSSYFITVHNLIKRCREEGIIVGSRGSAAGSLLSFLLDITQIDPLEYGLIFERFLNPERTDLPDYDLDFPANKRNRVLEIFSDQGSKRYVLCHILTYVHLQAKNVLRTVGRVYGLSEFEINYLSQFVKNISTRKNTLEVTLEEEEDLKNLLRENPKIREIYDISLKLEGLVTTKGVHAAGVVLVERGEANLIGTFKNPEHILDVSHHDMHDLERNGLIKFDILGIDSLAVVDLVLDRYDLNVGDFDVRDEQTFKDLREKGTYGLFQLSQVNTEILKRIKVRNIEEIAEVIGLNRPGSMDYIDDYIRRKNGESFEFLSQHKAVIDITRDTQGIFIGQEQIMNLVMQIANYTGGEADKLRKIIGKKKFDQMPLEKEKFIRRARAEMEEEEAQRLYSIIENFKGYGFNKSHGIAYSYNTFYMAYIKSHYRTAYYGAWLNIEKDLEKRLRFIQTASSEGVRFLGPNLNLSEENFKLEGDAIRFGLSKVVGISKILTGKILKARTISPFKDGRDLLKRVQFTRREIENLSKFGLENSMEFDLSEPKLSFNALKLVWKDLDIKDRSRKNLYNLVFNHVLDPQEDYTLTCRLLKIEKTRRIESRDNKRIQASQNRNSLLTFSDGSYSLKLLVDDFLGDKVRRFFKPLDWMVLDLNLRRSVKNLKLTDVRVYV